jgi:hypothetical protein
LSCSKRTLLLATHSSSFLKIFWDVGFLGIKYKEECDTSRSKETGSGESEVTVSVDVQELSLRMTAELSNLDLSTCDDWDDFEFGEEAWSRQWHTLVRTCRK